MKISIFIVLNINDNSHPSLLPSLPLPVNIIILFFMVLKIGDNSLLSLPPHSKAHSVLSMLRWSGPSAASFSDNSYSDVSILVDTPPAARAERTITLRVRCQGKVHKFDVHKVIQSW